MIVSGGEINVTSEHLEFIPANGNVYAPEGYGLDEVKPLSFRIMLSSYGVYLFKKAVVSRFLGIKPAVSKFEAGVEFSVFPHYRGAKVRIFSLEAKRGSSFVVPYRKLRSLYNALSKARYYGSEIFLNGERLFFKPQPDGLRIEFSKGGELFLDLAESDFLKNVLWNISALPVPENVTFERFGSSLSLKFALDNGRPAVIVEGIVHHLSKEEAADILAAL